MPARTSWGESRCFDLPIYTCAASRKTTAIRRRSSLFSELRGGRSYADVEIIKRITEFEWLIKPERTHTYVLCVIFSSLFLFSLNIHNIFFFLNI